MRGTGIPVPGAFPENPSSISDLVSAWVCLGTQVVTSERELAAGQHRRWTICLPRNRMLSWIRTCWGSCLPPSLHPCQSLLLTSWGLTGAIDTSALSSHLPRCRASFGDMYNVSVMCHSIFPVCQAFLPLSDKTSFYLLLPPKLTLKFGCGGCRRRPLRRIPAFLEEGRESRA